MKERIVWIDAVRGFAILLVVMGHIGQFTFHLDEKAPIMKVIYGFHMPLFFFLSGMFFNYTSLGTFVGKKAKSLLQPYLLLNLIPFIFMYGLGRIFEFGWFLPTLFLVCMYQYVAVWLGRVIGKNAWGGVIFTSLIVWVMVCGLYYSHTVNYPFMLPTIRNYPFYTFGLMYGSGMIDRWMSNKVVLSLCLLSLIPMYIYYDYLLRPVHLMGFPAIVLTVKFFRSLEKTCSLEKIGNITLEIYLLHMFFVPVFGAMPEVMNLQVNFIVQLLLTAGIAIPIVVCCIGIIKLVQMSDYLNRIFFGKY